VLGFHKEQLKSVGKLRKMLAFADGTVKKVFASLEMCWYSQKELLKSVSKFRNGSSFAEGSVKKLLASIEMCWHP